MKVERSERFMDFLGHAKSTITRRRECISETDMVQIEMGSGIEMLGRFVHQRDSPSGQLRAAKLGEDCVAAVERDTVGAIKDHIVTNGSQAG